MPAIVLIGVVGVATAGRAGPAQTAAPGRSEPAPGWTAAPAIAAAVPAVPRRQRETGTDGLMGRLPFDLPADPVVPLVNRFTIDDVHAGWSDLDTTPPWVRRLGGLGSYTGDPYQR